MASSNGPTAATTDGGLAGGSGGGLGGRAGERAGGGAGGGGGADEDLTPHTGFDPAGLVLALIVPGLGHIARANASDDPARRRRGFLVMAGVLGLFISGILIGGIDVVDSKEDRVWFFGQALVGPAAFAADYVHQGMKVRDPETGRLRSAYPDEGRDGRTGAPVPGGRPPNTKSLGRVNELGTLFSTIAGMLNLIAIIDAGFPTRRRVR